MSRLILTNGKKVEIPLDSGFLTDDDDEYGQDDEDEHNLEQWKIDNIKRRQ